jgi:hypothetical protein
MTGRARRCRIDRRAALGGLAGCIGAVALAGCGGSGVKPVTAADNGLVTFPGLGYKPVAAKVPRSAAAGSALVVGLTNTGSTEPHQMQLASDTSATGLRWSGWGTSTAVGHGTATIHICTSSCGAGFDRRYPATLTLSVLRTCGHHRFYERAALRLATTKGRRRWGAFVKTPCAGKE